MLFRSISLSETSVVKIMEDNTHEFTDQEIKDAFDEAANAGTNDNVVSGVTS